MANLRLQDITVTYEKSGVTALDNITLEAEDRAFTAILGPSGSGKTTLLRVIAGLEFPTEGKVFIGRRDFTGEPPFYRGGAMVFQNFPLYPNMTVYENICFVHTDKYRPSYKQDDLFQETVDLLGLERMLDRKPYTLSGGERQRVALARALMRSPDFFLLDEPLSNLDPETRGNVREAIVRAQRRCPVPFLYVTHDQQEAMSMAERIVVLRKGVIQQDAPPEELYSRPCNQFVASFVGSPQMNFIPSRVVRSSGGFAADVMGNMLELRSDRFPPQFMAAYEDAAIVLGVRPEHLTIDPMPDGLPACGRLDAAVISVECVGAGRQYRVKVGNTPVTITGTQNRTLRAGDRVTLSVAGEDVHLFEPETERNILCRMDEEEDA